MFDFSASNIFIAVIFVIFVFYLLHKTRFFFSIAKRRPDGSFEPTGCGTLILMVIFSIAFFGTIGLLTAIKQTSNMQKYNAKYENFEKPFLFHFTLNDTINKWIHPLGIQPFDTTYNSKEIQEIETLVDTCNQLFITVPNNVNINIQDTLSAYIYLEMKWTSEVGVILLKKGLARINQATTHPLRNMKQFQLKAEKGAKKDRKGFWVQ